MCLYGSSTSGGRPPVSVRYGGTEFIASCMRHPIRGSWRSQYFFLRASHEFPFMRRPHTLTHMMSDQARFWILDFRSFFLDTFGSHYRDLPFQNGWVHLLISCTYLHVRMCVWERESVYFFVSMCPYSLMCIYIDMNIIFCLTELRVDIIFIL